MTSTISNREQAILQKVIEYKEHSEFAWLEYEVRVCDPCYADRKEDSKAHANAFFHALQMFDQLEKEINEILNNENVEGDLLNEEG